MKRMQMTVAALAAMLAAGAVSAADFSSWQKSMKITFAGYNPPGGPATLTNFPALVVLSTNISGFSYNDFQSLTNQDLRFTASDGTTELNYEIDSWNTNGSSYVWLQVTNLVDTNTSVLAYWGKNGTTAPACTTNGAVWSNGYHGVWHMNKPDATDSTANRLNGTATANTNATGFFGTAQGFNGSSGFLRILDGFTPTAYTLSAWVRPSNTGAGTIVRRTDSGEAGSISHQLRLANTAIHYTYDGSVRTVTGTTTLNVGTWYHIVGVAANGSAVRLYVNGKEEGTAIATIGTLWTGGDRWNVGKANPDYFNGTIDELQYSTVVRSSNWVWACYMNQASNGVFAGSFNTYGTAQSLNASLPQISNVGSQNLKDTTADVVGKLITNGTSAATICLYWSTTDGMTNALGWTTSGGSVSNLGTWADGATFTNTLTNLKSNTVYYWNLSASNSAGTIWAIAGGSPSFKTAGTPAVNNGIGPSAIVFTTATLNGNMTNGVLAEVRIFWGTDSNNWAHTNDVGLRAEGGFSINITGLTPDTSYYYQCQATNAYGTAWSEVTNFATYPFLGGYYVTPTGAGLMNGVNWANAFGSIQSALDTCANNDTLYLEAGSYPISAQLSLSGKSGITISGGFAGSGSPGALNGANSTISRSANNMRILYAMSCTNVTLQRLTVTGGYLPQSDYGAGLRVENCPGFAVSDCTISNNTIAAGGGYNFAYGGGIYASASDVTLSNCLISANQANCNNWYSDGYGGGIYVNSGTCRVIRCELRGNLAAGVNQGGYGGQSGAICLNAGLLDVRNSLIAANDATGSYGYGDGVDVVNGTATLSLCTIVCNGGSGVKREAGTLAVSNSILWGNTIDATGTLTLNSCDDQSVGTGVTKNNCFSADPLFERGLYLSAGSPCVNAGSDTAANLGVDALTTRADGTTDSGTVDLGYHFAAGNNTSVAELYVAPSPIGNDTTGTGNAGAPYATITKALSLAQAGTRVHAAAGTYTRTTETMPLTFAQDGVQLLGTNAALTQLSGGGIGGVLVLQILNSCGDTRLEGLTIANGYQQGSGGGISASLSALTIASCSVTNNRLDAFGNYAQNFGAGIYLYNCLATVTNCQIRRNDASPHGARNKGSGGGLAALGGRCDIVDSVIAQNISAGDLVSYPYYYDHGGGLYLGSGFHSVRNSLVYTNTSQYDGDGIYVAPAGNPGDDNVLFQTGGNAQFRNVTIANNGGEGLHNGGTAVATNSIFWGNGVDVTGAVALAWCDAGIKDPAVTTNNFCLSTDPLFVNTAAGDYHEQSKGGSWHNGAWTKDAAMSPCIDAGDPADPRGALEPQPNLRNRINMGAYGGESQASKSQSFGGSVVIIQ